MATVDPWYWAYYNQIRLQSGTFSLAHHEYQIEPMQSDAKVKVVRKAAQLGFTEIEVLRTLHGQITELYPTGVLYLFPTSDDVSDFSKARFGPLIADNPETIGAFVQSTDSASIKRIGSSMLYLRGARSTQKVQGLKKDASKLRSIPVDKTVFDEIDLMDPDMVLMALERMSHSGVQAEAYLSTPTIPDYGIDKLYNASDQRTWNIRCPSCNRDCCLETDFPECIQSDRSGVWHRVCVKCGHDLDPSEGFWVPTYQGRDIAGWWISQLVSHYIDPGKVLNLFNNPPNGNIGEVYNSKLGLAYIAAENRLTLNDVYQCCGTDLMPIRDNGPCAMGVDVGTVLHVVIGKRVGGRKHIVWVGEVPEFNDLYDLASRFNVERAAVDYFPETRAVRTYRDKADHAVMMCRYQEDIKEGQRESIIAGVFDIARTEICDTTHHAVVKGEYVLPRRDTKIETYAGQMANLVKILEVDEKRGKKVYRYRKLAEDHYRHATNYFEIAAKRLTEAIIGDPIMFKVKQLNAATRQRDYNPLTYELDTGSNGTPDYDVFKY